MRILLWVLISISVLWGGYWFVGSSAVERGMTSWLNDNSDRSLNTQYSALNTIGFPNRFDTTIEDVVVAGLGENVTWSAPFFKILALSYKPNHLVAVWPNTQTLDIGYDRMAITTDRMRGSVVFKPDTALTLNRTALEISNFALQSNQGWSMAMQTGQFNTSIAPVLENAQDIVIQALDVRPPEGVAAILNPDNQLPEVIEALRFDATMMFDAPWDRFAIEQNLPRLAGMQVNRLQIIWGDMDFRASGQLGIDERGFLDGKLTIKAQNWRGIYQMLQDMGMNLGGFFGAVESILQLMALETDDVNYLEADWIFQGGRMRLGAIPLGPAPRLARR